jgi:hypothetical protein
MKGLISATFLFFATLAFGQTVAPQHPVEEQYHISYGWWILGVLLAIGVGIALYMLIKKDPKRDAVR